MYSSQQSRKRNYKGVEERMRLELNKSNDRTCVKGGNSQKKSKEQIAALL